VGPEISPGPQFFESGYGRDEGSRHSFIDDEVLAHHSEY